MKNEILLLFYIFSFRFSLFSLILLFQYSRVMYYNFVKGEKYAWKIRLFNLNKSLRFDIVSYEFCGILVRLQVRKNANNERGFRNSRRVFIPSKTVIIKHYFEKLQGVFSSKICLLMEHRTLKSVGIHNSQECKRSRNIISTSEQKFDEYDNNFNLNLASILNVTPPKWCKLAIR